MAQSTLSVTLASSFLGASLKRSPCLALPAPRSAPSTKPAVTRVVARQSGLFGGLFGRDAGKKAQDVYRGGQRAVSQGTKRVEGAASRVLNNQPRAIFGRERSAGANVRKGTQQIAKRASSVAKAASGTRIVQGSQKTVRGLKKAAEARYREGIFGTSGNFGFTKANELFVGRMAMLGFVASLVGEAVTGRGILSQFNLETGIPISEAEPLLLIFIAFTLVGSIGGWGSRGYFEADPLQPFKTDNARSALGLAARGPLFGFTKPNEIFVGRIAQLGIAASIIGEVITGKGALAQLNFETGVPIWELEPLVLFFITFILLAAINPGAGRFVNDEDVDE